MKSVTTSIGTAAPIETKRCDRTDVERYGVARIPSFAVVRLDETQSAGAEPTVDLDAALLDPEVDKATLPLAVDEPGLPLWTDDYSNIVQVMSWTKALSR